ncbi:MAG: ParA family protein [Desulfobacterales bacterium]|nr:ParA family protein [Desulfobacterales bacterium]
MPRIIALLNPRSATGKTTLAVNLAISFSLLEKKTLYVDCTSTGVGTRMVMDSNRSVSFGVAEVVSGMVGVKGALVAGKNRWIDLIPASAGEGETETLLAQNPDKERALFFSLRPLFQAYDQVVVDTPSGMGFFVRSALALATEVLIPLHPGWNVISQLKVAQECADDIRKEHNPALKMGGVVYMGEFNRILPTDIPCTGKLPHCDTLQKGMATGEPAAFLDIFSGGAQACLDLARSMV